jgi:drug/metabolite transporter (DMT)-like permease
MAGTAMANMLYFYLTIQTSALFASSVTYIMPLVAVAWGVVDGEALSIYHVLCSGIILTGVWLVNAPRLKTARR